MTANQIKDGLASFADEHDVRILFAVEDGSRAWGFESEDSDYDVRFVYAKKDGVSYVSVKELCDEHRFQDGTIDFCGWDVVKFFKQILAHNCVAVEWLRSPMVYAWSEDANATLPHLADLRPEVAFKHYYGLYRQTRRKAYGDAVADVHGYYAPAKQHLYMIRCLLCMLRLSETKTVDMSQRINRLAADIDSDVRRAIQRLVDQKRELEKSEDSIALEPVLWQWMETTVAKCIKPPKEERTDQQKSDRVDRLNATLHDIVDRPQKKKNNDNLESWSLGYRRAMQDQ